MIQNNSSIPVVHIIGAGGLARDFYACFKDEVSIEGFWDDGVPKGTLIKGIPVLGTLNDFCSLPAGVNFVIMVANPTLRKKFASVLSSSPHKALLVIHSLARIFDSNSVSLGNGGVVFPGSMITTEVTVGAHTLIHTNCSLHHDSVIGANCMLMPGSRLTGNVTVGNDVYIGPNVALTNGMKIGDGMRIEN